MNCSCTISKANFEARALEATNRNTDCGVSSPSPANKTRCRARLVAQLPCVLTLQRREHTLLTHVLVEMDRTPYVTCVPLILQLRSKKVKLLSQGYVCVFFFFFKWAIRGRVTGNIRVVSQFFFSVELTKS